MNPKYWTNILLSRQSDSIKEKFQILFKNNNIFCLYVLSIMFKLLKQINNY